jgi:hypothetical protein
MCNILTDCCSCLCVPTRSSVTSTVSFWTSGALLVYRIWRQSRACARCRAWTATSTHQGAPLPPARDSGAPYGDVSNSQCDVKVVCNNVTLWATWCQSNYMRLWWWSYLCVWDGEVISGTRDFWLTRCNC